MPRWSMLAALVVALVATGSCNLDVSNPNAPDKNRAFRDPGGLQQMIGGAFRTWVEARDGYYVMPLDAMADNYTASWNNASMRLYSSVGVDCPSRCGWVNQSTSPDVLPVAPDWVLFGSGLIGIVASIVGIVVTFKTPWVTQWTTHSWRVWLAIIVVVSALIAIAIYAISEYTHRREVPTPTPTPAG